MVSGEMNSVQRVRHLLSNEWMGQSVLRKQAGYSERATRDALKRLVEYGEVEERKAGHVKEYRRREPASPDDASVSKGKDRRQEGATGTGALGQAQYTNEPWRKTPQYVQNQSLLQNVVRCWADGAKVKLPEGKAYSGIVRAAHDVAAGVEQRLWTLGDLYLCTREKRLAVPERPGLYSLRMIAQDLPAWKAAHPHKHRGVVEYHPLPEGGLEEAWAFYHAHPDRFKTWDYTLGCWVESRMVEPSRKPLPEPAYRPTHIRHHDGAGIYEAIVAEDGEVPHLDVFFEPKSESERVPLLEHYKLALRGEGGLRS